jgi:predicted ribosome quality control (RQC) complex YloA/Tae2 family protein
VGRSDRENDAMTFRAARGEDLFLHVDGRSGSHVIVRMPRGKPVPEETLLDAAELACHYSAAKSMDRAQVIYARRKHVRRTGRGRAGQVSVSQEKRILLQRDPERLRRLLETKDKAQEVHP